RGQIDLAKRLAFACDARESQQVVDQGAHAAGGILHAFQVLAALFIEGRAAFALETVAEGLDLAKRLLQVVRRHRGEFLRFAIALFELGGERCQLLLRAFATGDVADKSTEPTTRSEPYRPNGELDRKNVPLAMQGQDLDSLVKDWSFSAGQE